MFPRLAPWPLIFNEGEVVDQGDCSRLQHHAWMRLRTQDPEHARLSASWQQTFEYAACLEELKPRFCNDMRAGGRRHTRATQASPNLAGPSS